MWQLIYASDLLFVVTIFMSKLAIALFLRRLSNVRQHKILSIGMAGACTLFGVISLLVVAIRQNTSAPWLYTSEVADGTVR